MISFSVYVFLGSTAGLIDMMTAMESLKLFKNGEYMVIFVDMMTYSTKESLKYLISKYIITIDYLHEKLQSFLYSYALQIISKH